MTAFDMKDMDIQRECENPAFLHFRHPAHNTKMYADKKKEKPLGVYLLGYESAEVKRAMDENKRESAKVREENDGVLPDEYAARADSKLLAAAATGWENLAWNKQETFSKQVIEEMFFCRPFLRRQALNFLLDLKNFVGRDEKTLSNGQDTPPGSTADHQSETEESQS